MANLIKNALIKQLSKFLKNVSSNQINISTFKGEGEMKNIELDEKVLMNLVELPTWLNITSARCNKATFKVQWTKLKTTPIIIGLDKIEIDMEITESLREPSNFDSKLFETDQNGPYTFIDKCIDAIQLNIDSITIKIKSTRFNCSMNISNICVYSCTPNWTITNDITKTRLKDLETEEIIVFKEISWEICRLEAFILEEQDANGSAPNNQAPASIKLIMNPSKIQIALKKKLSDKSLILGSTLRILLNEIYWMANDTQLKAAIGAYNMISKLMKKASLQQRKLIAQQKLTTQNAQKAKTPTNKSGSVKNDDSKVFMNYDIKETSLHLKISMLNIHMYADDNYSANSLIDGGAMQVLIKNLCIDHYPYHKAGYSMRHWNNYNHIYMQKEDWSKNLINDFVHNLETILRKSNTDNFNKIKLQSCLTLLEACTVVTLQNVCVYKVTTNVSDKTASQSSAQKARKKFQDSPPADKPVRKLSELLRTKEFLIEQQTYDKRPFFTSNFDEFNIPSDSLFMHFFFCDFYFSEDCNYPVPSSQMFAHVAPILLNVDYLTLLWANTLLLSFNHEILIVEKLNERNPTKKAEKPAAVTNSNSHSSKNESSSNLHVDINIEILMSKMVLYILPHASECPRNLSGIELGFSSICLTNSSLSAADANVRANLKGACAKVYESSKDLCRKQSKFFENSKICQFEEKLKILSPCFNESLNNQNYAYIRQDLSCNNSLTKLINTTNETYDSKLGLFLKSLNKSVLNKYANKDIWCIDLKSMWVDICSADPCNKKNLIKNTSFMLWVTNIYDFYKLNNTNYDNITNGIILSNSYEGFQTKKLDQIRIQLSKIIPIESPDKSLRNKSLLKRSKSLETVRSMTKRQDDSRYLYKELYSKMNIIGRIDQINISCDHDQLLFIFRFLETFDLLNEQLEADSENILKYDKPTNLKNRFSDLRKPSTRNMDLSYENSRNQIEAEFSPILNASIIINTISVELEINNYDLQSNDHKIAKSTEQGETEKKDQTVEDNIPTQFTKTFQHNLFQETFEKSNSLFDADDFNTNQVKSDANEKKSDSELVSDYLKFIYGFSQDNPTNKPIARGFSLDNPQLSSVAQKDLDIQGIEYSSKFPSSNSLAGTNMSVSFSSMTSSTVSLTSKTQAFSNKTASLFNNFNNVIRTVKNEFEYNEFPTENDTFVRTRFENDSVSLISLSTDLSLGSNMTMFKPETQQSISSINENPNINDKLTSSIQYESNLSNTSTSNIDMLCSKEYNDIQVQTTQQTIRLKIVLNNFQSYAQVNANSRIQALLQVDNLELDNRKSIVIAQKLKEKSANHEILIQFRKLKEDPMLKDGLLDLIVEDFSMELDVPRLNGIVDFIDDDGDETIEIKKSLPANIIIKNSQFILNKSVLNNLDKFKNKIKIGHLSVKKSAFNEIFIEDIEDSNINTKNKNNRSENICTRNDKSISHHYEMLAEKASKRPEQLASLVFLLRKSRQELSALKTDFEQEKMKTSRLESGIKERDEVIKTKETFNHYELERKQFESLLKTYEDENENLKTKLKKHEEMIEILNIERDCIIKNLNEQLKLNKR